MKAMTPIGPLVGKLMGQPPNLRELISSADGVTFWASYDKATPRARLRAARPRGGPPGDARGRRRTARSAGRVGPAASIVSVPMRVIDVMHLGRPHVIGCWEVDGMLVDPGPESSLHTVLEALGDEQPRGHPPHPHPPRPRRRDRRAGRALARPPGLRPRARRPSPDRPLAACWPAPSGSTATDSSTSGGEILPVPEANVQRPRAAARPCCGMQVAYTPGHASHHVCYLHEETGTAFVGDVAACRIPGTDLVIPPTPPPDIDVETWEESIALRRGLGAREARPHPLRRGRGRRPPTSRTVRRSRLREEAELARGLDEDDVRGRPAAPHRRRPRRPPRRPRRCSRRSRPPTSGRGWSATGAKPSARLRRRGRLAGVWSLSSGTHVSASPDRFPRPCEAGPAAQVARASARPPLRCGRRAW